VRTILGHISLMRIKWRSLSTPRVLGLFLTPGYAPQRTANPFVGNSSPPPEPEIESGSPLIRVSGTWHKHVEWRVGESEAVPPEVGVPNRRLAPTVGQGAWDDARCWTSMLPVGTSLPRFRGSDRHPLLIARSVEPRCGAVGRL
jgi:hypothetical protein